MDYGRLYWGALFGLGALLLVRHTPALVSGVSQAGNLPPVVGVLAGVGVSYLGGRGLYLDGAANAPERPGVFFAVIVLAFLLQAVAVVGWLAGLWW